MNDEKNGSSEGIAREDTSSKETVPHPEADPTRREFIGQVTGCGVGAFALQFIGNEELLAQSSPAPANTGPGTTMKVAFEVNGKARSLEVDTRTTLLDALREHLHLT